MLPIGHEVEFIVKFFVGILISFLWLTMIIVLFIRWLRQNLPRIKTMTIWEWFELSGWVIAISALTACDSYLIFFR